MSEHLPAAVWHRVLRILWSSYGMMLVLSLAAPSATAAADPPAAQGDGEKPRFGSSVEVTAPPVVAESRVDDSGSLITIVSSQQVEDLNAQDLAAALRRVPGVVISRFNPVGSYGGAQGGSIFIRGQGSGRPGAEIVTMIDGIPRFVGVWTHPLLDTLSLDLVERVEVARSAQPVRFGGMSFASVNIVPKRGRDLRAGARLLTSRGSFSTAVARLEDAGHDGAVDWVASASHRSSDGHRPGADGRVDAGFLNLGLALRDGWDVLLTASGTDAWAHDPGIEGEPRPPQRPRFADRDLFTILALTHRDGTTSSSLRFYADDGDIDWDQWDDSAAEPFNTATHWFNRGLRLHHRRNLGKWGLELGLDHDLYGGTSQETHVSGPRPEQKATFRSTAPWVLVSRSFGDHTLVVPAAGVRYTDTRYFGGQWGAQVGLRVIAGGTSWYATAARAFNLPGVWTAFMSESFGGGESWHELAPERLVHLEAGVVQQASANLEVTVSIYTDRVTDALRFVPPPPPPPRFANIGAYRTRGLEGSLSASSRHTAFFLGFTLTDTDPADVPETPRGTVSTGFTWVTARGVRTTVDAQWVDSRSVLNPRFAANQVRVGSYGVVSGRVAVPLESLHVPGDGELFLAAENLTDSDYEMIPGYPMPGRAWTLGLDLEL